MGGGQDALQLWTLDEARRRIEADLVPLGKLKRNIVNIAVSRKLICF